MKDRGESVELYLLTGFLGAGKTTCVKNILKLWKDKKIALIINEFGKQGVDGKLLETVGVELEEINNGSIFCTCKMNRFEEVLQDMMERKPEIILIEASGLSDPTSAYAVLQQEKFRAIHYKGCLCMVDAARFPKVIQTAKVSRKQVRIADQVIINKIDLVKEEALAEVRRTIAFYNPQVTIHETHFGQIALSWLEALDVSEKVWDDKVIATKDITLQRYTLAISEQCTKESLIKMLESFIEDTYRIKGFLLLEGERYLVDCVGDTVCIETYEDEIPSGNKLVVLSGEGMPLSKSLKRTGEMYCNQLLQIER